MSSSAPNSTRRQPGRPPADGRPDSRDALIDAASRLFAAYGTDGVSLRRIADEAGVTPAMVNYYFGGKKGLHEAMLQRTFARIIEGVRSVAARGKGLDDLLEVLLAGFAAEPWIATLVLREVLSENGAFREQFIRNYAVHMADLLPEVMRREIEANRFREDLDPRLAFLSFMGMTIMPFVARPVVERVLGIDYDEAFLERFTQHTYKLFIEGARA